MCIVRWLEAFPACSQTLTLPILAVHMIRRFVIKGSKVAGLTIFLPVLCTYGSSHMTRPLLMICVPPLLPQGQPSLCGAALLQWSAESHLYETAPVPVDKVVNCKVHEHIFLTLCQFLQIYKIRKGEESGVFRIFMVNNMQRSDNGICVEGLQTVGLTLV